MRSDDAALSPPTIPTTVSGLHPDDVRLVHEACAGNLPAVADSLRRCLRLDEPLAFELGEPVALEEAPPRGALDGPGLVVLFHVGAETMACLVPATFPLPDWCREPGDGESARLQTLAREWSLNLLPVECEAHAFESRAVDDLAAFVASGAPADGAVAAELVVKSTERSADASGEGAEAGDDDDADGDDAVGDDAVGDAADEAGDSRDSGDHWIRLVWPLTAVAEPAAESEPEPESESASGAELESGTEPAAKGVDPPGGAGGLSARDPAAGRAALIRGLSVPISVRLAEKQIDVGHLLKLTPGALVTFNKNCEDPLDLYVNNRRFARGEAVKIGEKFGLKIDEIGNREERRRRILDG